MNKQDFLWSEKYRPKTIEECILPNDLKNTFKKFIDQKEIPNTIFCGSSGLGKTTVARALCESLSLDYILINGSEDSGIDVLRNRIRSYASTVSLSDNSTHKVVILDESDYLNPNSTQPALRAFIEEFSKNCRFIFTANHKNRLIPALHSRCTVIDFSFSKSTVVELSKRFFVRFKEILKKENITITDNKKLAEFLFNYAPDWRRVLNEAQALTFNNVLEIKDFSSNNQSFDKLILLLKNKQFGNTRQWVTENADLSNEGIFRTLYDKLYTQLEPASIPEIILIINEYQYKAAFVADKEINMMACFTEIMTQAKWKT